jgi:L-lysine 2,3-aminomutase
MGKGYSKSYKSSTKTAAKLATMLKIEKEQWAKDAEEERRAAAEIAERVVRVLLCKRMRQHDPTQPSQHTCPHASDLAVHADSEFRKSFNHRSNDLIVVRI